MKAFGEDWYSYFKLQNDCTLTEWKKKVGKAIVDITANMRNGMYSFPLQ